ncbi:hypothetical protein FOA52_012093, partial [Chlamydomonas sp. UWO 241]
MREEAANARFAAMQTPVLDALRLPCTFSELGLKIARGQEQWSCVAQRLGFSLHPRRDGPLIWFHAADIGECSVALPVLFRCLLEYNEKVAVLLTTASPHAYALLKDNLPQRVTVQLVPLDNTLCIRLFLRAWRPQAGIVMNSPLYPSLVAMAAQHGVRLALLNASLSGDEVLRWHSYVTYRSLLSNLLAKFDLIVPLSDMDFGHFCLFGAEMRQMPGWCGDLKHASALGAGMWYLSKPAPEDVKALRQGLHGRPTWVASHTVPGEEALAARVHKRLAGSVPHVRSVMVPADPARSAAVAACLRDEHALTVDEWAGPGADYNGDVLLVPDHAHLNLLYSVCDTVLMANSMLDSCKGESLAAPAVAGCAVLVGPYTGANAGMAEELNAAAVAAAEEAAAAVRSAGTQLEDTGGHPTTATAARAAEQSAGAGGRSSIVRTHSAHVDGHSASGGRTGAGGSSTSHRHTSAGAASRHLPVRWASSGARGWPTSSAPTTPLAGSGGSSTWGGRSAAHPHPPSPTASHPRSRSVPVSPQRAEGGPLSSVPSSPPAGPVDGSPRDPFMALDASLERQAADPDDLSRQGVAELTVLEIEGAAAEEAPGGHAHHTAQAPGSAQQHPSGSRAPSLQWAWRSLGWSPSARTSGDGDGAHGDMPLASATSVSDVSEFWSPRRTHRPPGQAPGESPLAGAGGDAAYNFAPSSALHASGGGVGSVADGRLSPLAGVGGGARREVSFETTPGRRGGAVLRPGSRSVSRSGAPPQHWAAPHEEDGEGDANTDATSGGASDPSASRYPPRLSSEYGDIPMPLTVSTALRGSAIGAGLAALTQHRGSASMVVRGSSAGGAPPASRLAQQRRSTSASGPAAQPVRQRRSASAAGGAPRGVRFSEVAGVDCQEEVSLKWIPDEESADGKAFEPRRSRQSFANWLESPSPTASSRNGSFSARSGSSVSASAAGSPAKAAMLHRRLVATRSRSASSSPSASMRQRHVTATKRAAGSPLGSPATGQLPPSPDGGDGAASHAAASRGGSPGGCSTDSGQVPGGFQAATGQVPGVDNMTAATSSSLHKIIAEAQMCVWGGVGGGALPCAAAAPPPAPPPDQHGASPAVVAATLADALAAAVAVAAARKAAPGSRVKPLTAATADRELVPLPLLPQCTATPPATAASLPVKPARTLSGFATAEVQLAPSAPTMPHVVVNGLAPFQARRVNSSPPKPNSAAGIDCAGSSDGTCVQEEGTSGSGTARTRASAVLEALLQ